MKQALGLPFGLLLLLLHLSGLAQTPRIVHGRVRTEATAKPIAAASIVLFQVTEGDTLPIAFGITDGQGDYRIRFLASPGRYWLSARALGYAAQTLSVVFSDTTETQFDANFSLPVKALQLKEVVVTAPIVEKKDTIIYQAKAFTDGTEKNVEDLLRKLPGVQVGDNGKITVRGKPVEKVMLEGEDLFSKNYRLITRTLSAGLLDKIETIDNYNENSLLRDIEKSGKMALNLRINDHSKIHWFGNGSLTPGTNQRYEAEGTLFSLAGRTKMGFVFNTNTLSHDPAGVLTDNSLTDEPSNRATGITDIRLPAPSATVATLPDVASQRYLLSRIVLPGLTWSYPARKHWKTNGFVYLNNAYWQSGSRSEIRYLLEGNPIRVRDSVEIMQHVSQIVGQWRIDYQPNAKTTAKLTILLNQANQRGDSYINSENVVFSDTIQTVDHQRPRMNSYAFNAVRRLRGRQALVADLTWDQYDLPRQLTVSSKRFTDLFTGLGLQREPFVGLEQATGREATTQKIALRWVSAPSQTSVSQHNIGVEAIYLRQNEPINTTLFGLAFPDSKRVVTDSTFQNQARYQQSLFRIGGNWQQQKGRFRLLVNAALQGARVTLQAVALKEQPSYHRLWVLPTISIGYDLSQQHRFMATFSRSAQLPPLANLLPGYLFTSYRTTQRGTPALLVGYTNNYLLSYRHSNWSKWLTTSGNLSVSQTNTPFFSALHVSNTLTSMVYQPYLGDLWLYTLGGQIETLVNPLSSKLKIDISGNLAEQVSQTNEILPIKSQVRSLNGSIYLMSTLDGPVNAEIGLKSTISLLNNNEDNIRQQLIHPTLNVRWKPATSIRIKVAGEYYTWLTSANRAESLFLDAQLLYTPSKSNWWLIIEGNNLLNTKQIAFASITPFLETRQLYSLQPGFVTAQIGWRF